MYRQKEAEQKLNTVDEEENGTIHDDRMSLHEKPIIQKPDVTENENLQAVHQEGKSEESD